MKKELLVFFLLISIALKQDLFACDVCGGLTMGNLGLLTTYKDNFVGVSWQFAKFHAGQEFETKDGFHTMELFARISVAKRFKVLIHQPYRVNTRNAIDEQQSVHGISDTRLLINYTITNDLDLGHDFKLYAESAIGIKFPIGKYDASIHDKNIPENFNIGNGSVGYIFQPAVVISKNTAGVVCSGFYQYNAKSTSGYHFGSQGGGRITTYKQYRLSDQFNVVPNVGASFETLASDTYANQKTVHGTGGNGGFAVLACQLKHAKWMFGMSYQTPLWSNYSDGEVIAKNRFSVQLNFIF